MLAEFWRVPGVDYSQEGQGRFRTLNRDWTTVLSMSARQGDLGRRMARRSAA
jgi:hypothetical protein